jgi:tryptophanyl-tRNA synthetase
LDILFFKQLTFCFIKANAVPVGEDQVPHVEITREIARKFNNQYGKFFLNRNLYLLNFARLPGLDGECKNEQISWIIQYCLSDDPETS